MWEDPYAVFMCLVLGGIVGYEVSMDHLSPRGMMLPITFVGYETGDGVAKARARLKQELLLCSLAVTTVWGQDQ